MELPRTSPSRPQGYRTPQAALRPALRPRDTRRRLLHRSRRLCLATAATRLPALEDRLPLLQDLAYRRHLGEDARRPAQTSEGAHKEEPAAQCGDSGWPVGEDHWRRRTTARLRWRQEGQRT